MAAYRLSAAAETDIIDILAYTQDRFSAAARARYEALLIAALRDIAMDPERLGSASRPELGLGVRTYHLRHARRRGRATAGTVRTPRHLLLYRVLRSDLIGIGRVLYDGMELERHLPDRYGDG